MEQPWLGSVPWSVSLQEFRAAAADVADNGACCVFVIDDAIPPRARGGYAALVIAHARAIEPVTIFEDGTAALLITEGGVDSGEIAARRIIGKAGTLGLETTLRAGVVALTGDMDAVLKLAREAAGKAPAGGVSR
jgi:hypothetical protein